MVPVEQYQEHANGRREEKQTILGEHIGVK